MADEEKKEPEAAKEQPAERLIVIKITGNNVTVTRNDSASLFEFQAVIQAVFNLIQRA